MPILNRVAEMQEDVAGWRRHLHQHPELLHIPRMPGREFAVIRVGRQHRDMHEISLYIFNMFIIIQSKPQGKGGIDDCLDAHR